MSPPVDGLGNPESCAGGFQEDAVQLKSNMLGSVFCESSQTQKHFPAAAPS